MKNLLLAFLLAALVLAISCTKDVVDLSPEETDEDTTTLTQVELCDTLVPTYRNDIKPIMEASCAFTGCHGSNSANGNFTNDFGLKQKVDNGTLENRVLIDQTMPPSGPLPQTELDIIKCWIENGAPSN